ncbi:aldose epimerase family protein [Maribacter cobaltidurans]|uniref:Aldose 1-epimerase n=1 Tax=Maribacter cobaltidurans TaxID=1178778 RepID=A0A223V1C9_9FLAO|nr:aldose epimerase family protein [Maribacter cobaltidurans]ASV29215.1 galactose-1-epimerase [Maribacter cobaltidurans]GGD70967.1 aldose 1-epimerase [Maribacter cobaltidurans]
MKRVTNLFYAIALLSTVAINVNCKGKTENKKNVEMPEETIETVTITQSDYGETQDGEKVTMFSLKNEGGIEVDIITYGGRITSLRTPDKDGNMENVVLGFDDLAQYEKDNPFFGALIGRYGNRIAKGKFSIGEEDYTLAQNNGENSLHGGIKGFDKQVWDAKTEEGNDSVSLILTYLSKDMEEGFPGNLSTTVTYTLHNNNSLDVLYEATTDKATVVNLTQHAYFNLSGDFSNTILDHVVEIDADAYLPVDSGLIPTGELRPVEGTPFDFREPKTVGQDISEENEQLKLGGGYDHCWVLNDQQAGFRKVASAYHPATGRFLEVSTDEPGIQFYTGNFLDGTLPAPNNGIYGKRSGLCLETQHYPDSPNQEEFPSVVLNPGEKYVTKTTFKLTTK